jgi:hypothetical protein
MLKIGLDGHTFLDWNGVSPKLIFGYLVGVSSFWWWVEHLEACSDWLDGFMEYHITTVPLGSVGPTPFAPSTRVPSLNILHKNFVEGGGGTTV